MFGLFNKNKKKVENDNVAPKDNVPDIAHMSDAKQKLFQQLRDMRTEMGPEEIAKMKRVVQIQALKKKIKDDIMNDATKRERLLDDIRFHMRDK